VIARAYVLIEIEYDDKIVSATDMLRVVQNRMDGYDAEGGVEIRLLDELEIKKVLS